MMTILDDELLSRSVETEADPVSDKSSTSFESVSSLDGCFDNNDDRADGVLAGAEVMCVAEVTANDVDVVTADDAVDRPEVPSRGPQFVDVLLPPQLTELPRSMARLKLADRYIEIASSSSTLSSQSASTDDAAAATTVDDRLVDVIVMVVGVSPLRIKPSSSDRELDTLTSTPLVLDPVDVFTDAYLLTTASRGAVRVRMLPADGAVRLTPRRHEDASVDNDAEFILVARLLSPSASSVATTSVGEVVMRRFRWSSDDCIRYREYSGD
jgi:hypothetical protein